MKRVAFALLLVACANENDPQTWIKRLDDPNKRAAAVQKLEGMHDDAALEPLTRTYASGGLDRATSAGLLAYLAATHDARTAPALTKAFAVCSGPHDDDTRVAAESVSAMAGDLHDRTLIDALWACFASYAPSKGSTRVGDALRDAVFAVHDPSYAGKAIALLDAPIVAADSLTGEGARKINDPLDQWQPTAIRLLGGMHDTGAVRPLVTLLMTRTKLPLAPPATEALAMMARDAEPVLASALDGSDPEFSKQRAEWSRDDGWAPIIVTALAATGLDTARDAVLAAIPSLSSDANRAAAAESLVWFASSPKVIETYQSTFAKLPAIERVGDVDHGIERAALLQAASDLFEPRLLDWVLTESAHAKGETMLAAKASALQSAIKLMRHEDEPRVAAAIDRLENHSGLSAMERAEIATNVHKLFDAGSKAAGACLVDASCYVKLLDEAIPADGNANWYAIKAANMAGLYGEATTRKALTSRIAKITNPGVRHAMALAILHLAPQGDAADAAILDATGDSELVKIARALRARP